MAQQVTVVFDIGKTNKKFFLFDEELTDIGHEYIRFDEVEDDEGYPCEDLGRLVDWIRKSAEKVLKDPAYKVRAINFSTYGASLVHLGKDGKPVIPFYNYMKPFPEELRQDFFEKYGGEDVFSLQTASPAMGMLNSGMQLYFLKYRKPEVMNRLYKSLHFPQYLSALFTGRYVSDYTSLGCHTGLWDFRESRYAGWLENERLTGYLTPVEPSSKIFHVQLERQTVKVGVGVHDSSSALVPYLNAAERPFVLISTGTWSICMNFFNEQGLTQQELASDCLNFLSIKGQSVKASRLFLGRHLSLMARKLSAFFNVDYQTYKSMEWKGQQVSKRKSDRELLFDHGLLKPERFGFVNNLQEDLSVFDSYEEAYYHLMDELTDLQIASLRLAVGTSGIRDIFIDGGFSSNEVFIQMLANKLPEYRIFSTSFALGTALGAALLVNYRTLPGQFLEKNYKVKEHLTVDH